MKLEEMLADFKQQKDCWNRCVEFRWTKNGWTWKYDPAKEPTPESSRQAQREGCDRE